jgi:hypothetical protein
MIASLFPKVYNSFFYFMKMNAFKQFLIFILINSLLAGCKIYEPVNIQLLKPAKVRIAPEANKVLIINHANYTKARFSSNSKNESPAISDSTRTNQYIIGLLDVLKNSPRFDFNNKIIYIEKPDYKSQYKSLEWPVIESLCAEYKTDAAIVLENYQLSYYYPIKIKALQWGYSGKLEIENSALWKIYSAKNKQVISDILMGDTVFWNGSGENERQILQSIPPLNDAIMLSCYYAGVKYGEHIAQTWQSKQRFFINCENTDFQTALSLANQNKWPEAVEIWKKYPYGKNKRLASFAAYNIAVASEVLDHIDIALEWASKSYLLRHNKDTENYISILEKRVLENKEIENQLKQ